MNHILKPAIISMDRKQVEAGDQNTDPDQYEKCDPGIALGL